MESGLGCYGLGSIGLRRRSLASRHVENWLRNFVEHLVGTSKSKGCKTLFKYNPNPCKNKEIQHKNKKHNPYQWIVPLNNKNLGENKKWWKTWVFGKWGKWGKWGWVLYCGGTAVVEEGMVYKMMVFVGYSGCVWEMREREECTAL
jgi:hypothetical protein